MEKDVVSLALDALETGVKSVEREVEGFARPARISLFKRFPIIFTLVVTFGVASVFFGFERLLQSNAFLNGHPLLVLLFGVCVLIITGTLYKKL